MMNTGFRFGQALLFCLFVSASIFYAIAASEEASVQRVITAPLKDGRTNIIDGSGKEYAIDSVSLDGKGDWTGDSTRVSVSTVALFTLAMAVASGLGAVPFFFVELDPQWSGICNGMAAGVMLAASFDLIQGGQEHGSGGWVVCGILAGGIFILLCKKLMTMGSYNASRTCPNKSFTCGDALSTKVYSISTTNERHKEELAEKLKKLPSVPVLRLDALGREIDEQGNVFAVPKQTSTLKEHLSDTTGTGTHKSI